jgi:ribosomal protein L7/L12
MGYIHIKGWKEGLQKVALTKLQMDLLGLSLKESKENVDSLLEGDLVRIFAEDLNVAQEFISRAVELGVDWAVLDMYK